MSFVITEELKAKAEIHYGSKIGRQNARLLLKEIGLPAGLLPLEDITESGYVEETGFVWLKQKKKVEHFFDKIGRLVYFAPEITAYVEKGRIKKVTGIKSKEMMLWLAVSEIYVGDPPTGNLTCRTTSGLSRVFPTSAFEIDDEEDK